jgi:3-oxoacyl-[acyl-carrier-protein] synthase II
MSENAGSTNGRRRVVVTGVGALTPLGNDAETFWSGLLAGQSGADTIRLFNATPYPVRFACELKDFDPTVWVDR